MIADVFNALDDGDTAPLRDVLDGDAFRQYDAVWHFIQTLPARAGKP